MGIPDERSERDARLVSELLQTLGPTEREALFRFFVLGQPEQQVARDLALDAREVRRLRRTILAAFARMRAQEPE